MLADLIPSPIPIEATLSDWIANQKAYGNVAVFQSLSASRQSSVFGSQSVYSEDE